MQLVATYVLAALMQLLSTKAGRHFALVPWDLMQHVATYVLQALMQLLSTRPAGILRAAVGPSGMS